MQVHLRAPRVDEDLGGVVVQIKRNVQDFLCDLYPLRVFALLL